MPFNFKRKIKRFKRTKRDLPKQVGNIAKNHYLKAFREEGFTDTTLNKWQKRSTRNRSDRRTTNRRNLLVNRGHLRRSIKVGKATFSRIEVGSYGIKYAQYHNRGAGRLPKRQFVGKSAVMNDKIRRKIRKEVKDVFR